MHPNLLKNLEKAIASGSSLTSFAQNFLKSMNNGSYGPQPELEATLHQLATKEIIAFYNGSIGQNIVAELQQQNVSWRLESDLASYQVQRPNYIEVGGFFLSIFSLYLYIFTLLGCFGCICVIQLFYPCSFGQSVRVYALYARKSFALSRSAFDYTLLISF